MGYTTVQWDIGSVALGSLPVTTAHIVTLTSGSGQGSCRDEGNAGRTPTQAAMSRCAGDSSFRLGCWEDESYFMSGRGMLGMDIRPTSSFSQIWDRGWSSGEKRQLV